MFEFFVESLYRAPKEAWYESQMAATLLGGLLAVFGGFVSTVWLSWLNRRAERKSLVAGLRSEVHAIHSHLERAALLVANVRDANVTGSMWLLPYISIDELHTSIYRSASGKMALLEPKASAELADYYGKVSSLHRQVTVTEGITDFDLKIQFLRDTKERFNELLEQGESISDRIR